MYLKRIELLGFKTFAARTVLEFRPGITAIVGPNGSGKSNILDAMRWVLGEQSYTALRSKRAEDLIFGGGTRRAPAGFAEVSLTIDNSDRLLPLPYSEVTFTRRATRAGESEYQINRSRVRLRDIQEAIGPLGGSYTIINQGLVDAALNLRPEDRRRLFEDAAEIGVYEQRKHDSERRLRETAANIQRCDDVLADLEPRLRSLKRQASLARTHRELSGELRGLLIRSYAAQRRAAHTALAAAEAAEQSAAEQMATARARQAAAQAEQQQTRDALRALREQLQGLHASSSALHERAEAAQRDLAVGAERAAAAAQRAEDIERQQRDLDLRRADLAHDRDQASARLASTEAHLAEQRAAVQSHEQALAAREAERRAARQALDQAQRAELQAAAALAESQRRAEQIARRQEQLAQERATIAPGIAQATAHVQARRAAQAQADEAAQQAALAAEQAARSAEQARADLEARRQEQAQADEALAQARRVLADAEARLESLSRLQRSYTGTFAGVRGAMQWAENQRRRGFVLVSSIVRTPPELETAIEVALGSRLQNIVVEHWADAEDAIEALRRSGAGRATFLPLDTIADAGPRGRGGEQREAVEESGVLGIAAALVEYDELYAAVVWSLLGRTLVTHDLAAARRALNASRRASQRAAPPASFVTLAGEQVNAGGAVTGGAQIRESGALRRERELRELPEQVEALRGGLGEAQHARAAAEQQAGAAEQARRDAEQSRRRAQQELEAARDALDHARRASAQAEAELALQQRRDQQIGAELHDLEEQLRALAAEREGLHQRERQAHERLAALREEDQARAATDEEEQQRLAGLRGGLAAAEGEARAERSLIQSHEQGLARLAAERREAEQRAASLASERAALETRARELEQNHATLLAAIDQLRQQIDPAEAELEAGEQRLAQVEQRASALTTALIEGESAHGRAAVEVQRSRDRLEALWERAAADDIDIDALPEPAPPGEEATAEGQGPAPGTADGDAPAPEPEEAAPEAPVSPIAQRPSSIEGDQELSARIQQLRARIQRLGAVNPLALEEYEESSQRYDFLSAQLADLRAAERALGELIAELDGAMQTRFEVTFRAVAAEFERSFEQLFGGGQARLILTRPDGEEAAEVNGVPLGVDIVARPPGKRQQTLALLSGGERALTAAALLFAILKVNPSPFCVLDEVDAALDEANVGRFREVLLELARQTQFLVITHNRGTIEAADTIYGVSMGEDSSSRMLSVRLDELMEQE